MTGFATGAGTGACSSYSGVLNLTRGLRRDPPRVRTIAVVRKGHRGRAQLTDAYQGKGAAVPRAVTGGSGHGQWKRH